MTGDIRIPWINRLHVAYKLLFCAVLATVASCLYAESNHTLTRILPGWDVFCFAMPGFYWFAFVTTTREYINREAR